MVGKRWLMSPAVVGGLHRGIASGNAPTPLRHGNEAS